MVVSWALAWCSKSLVVIAHTFSVFLISQILLNFNLIHETRLFSINRSNLETGQPWPGAL